MRLGLPGVASFPEDKRIYPNKTLATQILGLVGSDGQGLAGMEYAENSKLSGKPGRGTVITEPPRAGEVLRTVSSSPAQPGQNVGPDNR